MSPETIARALRAAVGRDEPLWLDASGSSMEPTIVSGARVLLVPGHRPRRGEVWAFCDGQGQVIVHRYRGRRGAGLVFQGDAHRRPDPVATPAHLVGRVVAIDRGGRIRRLGCRDRLTGELRRLARLGVRRARRRLARRLATPR